LTKTKHNRAETFEHGLLVATPAQRAAPLFKTHGRGQQPWVNDEQMPRSFMATPSSAAHILVINDTQEVLEVIRELLEEEGFRVTLYSRAVRDLDEIRSAAPDLIIFDHLMGEEEYGWQLVQLVRLDRELQTLPLIVCSAARKMIEELGGHLKAQNVTVILKPFNIDELLEAVNTALATSAKT
jgi:CheY-like chemotaxis protein